MIHSILLLIGIAVFVTGIVIAFGGNPISALSPVYTDRKAVQAAK
jgi:hypothetical protein